MAYFRKELPRRTIFTPEGSAVPVFILDDSVGIITTSDPKTVEFLSSIVGSQGLTEITQFEADALKKKTKLQNIEQQLRLSKTQSGGFSKKQRAQPPGKKPCGVCGGRKG